MKKNNKKGFFLSETMVVITVVAVVLLGVFKLFSSVYTSFNRSEKYNSVTAINALSNIQKYYESLGNIDISSVESNPYVEITNNETYSSEYYTKLKEELHISKIYLINTTLLLQSEEINDFYVTLRTYIKTLKNQNAIVLLVVLNTDEFASTKIVNYSNIKLIGDESDEYAVYIPIGGSFVEPGYKNWTGEEPIITWENGKELDTNKKGTYYKHYNFNGYLLRRKVVVGYPLVSTYIKSLFYNYPSVNSLTKDDTVDKNIRYAGPAEGENAVKNQVYFNCAPSDGTNSYGSENYKYKENCEIWRIIGVFDVAKEVGGIKEKRIKLVRNDSLLNASWDSSRYISTTDHVNNGRGINQWGSSTYNDGTTYEGADIMRLLNEYYIGKSGATCKYCTGSNQGECTEDCTSSVNPISNLSLKMVEDALWNTGAISYNETLPASTLYEGERSNASGKICTLDDIYCSDLVNRTTTWNGKIALIYPSDYAYASGEKNCINDVRGEESTCNDKNWLQVKEEEDKYWTLSPQPSSENAYRIWFINNIKKMVYTNVSVAYKIYPSLYLNASVKIIGGSGTDDEPYILN